MADYLRLMAGLCRAQQQVFDDPPLTAPFDAQRFEACQQHGLLPFAADTPCARMPAAVARRLLQRYVPADQPAVIDALDTLRAAGPGQLRAWAVALVSGQYSLVPAALVPFLGAALQTARATGC